MIYNKLKWVKKILSTILIITLAFNTYICFAEDNIDVNVYGGEGVGYEGGGAGENNLIKANLDIKGARVSLWDTETQDIDRISNLIGLFLCYS